MHFLLFFLDILGVCRLEKKGDGVNKRPAIFIYTQKNITTHYTELFC
jgi:hypothetical protein